MDKHQIFKLCHAPIPLDDLQPTARENIFINPHGWADVEVYYDGLMFTEVLPLMRDEQYRSIKTVSEKFKKLEATNDWRHIFQIIEKKIGLPTYIKRFADIPDNQKYDAFINIYTRSDFGFEILKDKYSEIFSYAKFSELRQERLQTLYLEQPFDKITIYHGESLTYPVYDHYSWTLSKKVAEFFAYRYGGAGEIWRKTIPVEDAIDYLCDRNEAEILFDYA